MDFWVLVAMVCFFYIGVYRMYMLLPKEEISSCLVQTTVGGLTRFFIVF